MFVYSLDLANSSRVLKLCHRVLLDGKHNAILSNDRNGCGATIYSFKSVLNLEELAIRSKHSDRLIVGWHDFFFFLFKLLTNILKAYLTKLLTLIKDFTYFSSLKFKY